MTKPSVTTRHRIKPSGQSGKATLNLPTLVQDKARRSELKAKDLEDYRRNTLGAAYVGPMQDPTVDENDPVVQEKEFIRNLFLQGDTDWEKFIQ